MNMTVLYQSPHPTWLHVFFPFPQDQGIIKENIISEVGAIKRAVTEKQWRIQGKSHEECIEAWQRRIGKGVILKRANFEREHLYLGSDLNVLWRQSYFFSETLTLVYEQYVM